MMKFKNKILNIEQIARKKSIYSIYVTSEIGLHSFLTYIQLNLSSTYHHVSAQGKDDMII